MARYGTLLVSVDNGDERRWFPWAMGTPLGQGVVLPFTGFGALWQRVKRVVMTYDIHYDDGGSGLTLFGVSEIENMGGSFARETDIPNVTDSSGADFGCEFEVAGDFLNLDLSWNIMNARSNGFDGFELDVAVEVDEPDSGDTVFSGPSGGNPRSDLLCNFFGNGVPLYGSTKFSGTIQVSGKEYWPYIGATDTRPIYHSVTGAQLITPIPGGY